MTDNTRAKSHLNTIEATLSTRNMTSIDSIVTYNSMKLYENLSNQNLFVDGNIVNKLNNIHSKLIDRGHGSLYGDIQNRINDLNTERSAAGTSRRRVTEINAEIGEFNARLSNLTARAGEYENLHNYASSFDLTPTAILSNLDINTGATPVTGTTRISLSNFLVGGTTYTPEYKLCNEDGSEIPIVLSTPPEFSFKTNIGGQEYTIKKVKFSGGNLDFSNMEISPALKNSPVEVPLSINAVFNSTTTGVPDVNVVYNKKFKLKMNNGVPVLNTVASREAAFQDYEDSGGRHAISEQLNTKINVRDNNPTTGKNVLEREAIESALKYEGGTQYSTLSEGQKRLFYERIYRLGFFNPIYNAGGIIDTGNARYDKMKIWFTSDDKSRNKDNNFIKSPTAYKTFIHSNLGAKCDEYILTKLKKYLQDDTKNTELKAELSKFLQEIDQNKIDNDSVNSSISEALKNGKKYKMKRGPRSPFRPRDVNYMRFFSNSSASLKRQQVNIYSNIDNPEPINYDMDLNITGKNNIEVQLKIDGTDEIIKQKSAQPSTLVRKIMRDQRIKHGKVRAHIGFNIYKSIIQIAQEKNISLTYRGMEGKIGGSGSRRTLETRKITLDKNGNIVVKQINHLTTTNTEKDIFVFDQNSFLNVNEFDTGQTNGILRNGIETLGQHFNLAMNHLHKQYRKGTEKKLGNLIYSKNRMYLPTSFWLSPIKKILNAKTITNFDFNTTVNAGGKNIKIDFVKNKFTIDMEGLKKPISSRDLGKLLNHREGKVRVFDGIERDIVEGVYSTLIDNLRKNAKIARTNFGVVDDITGNMYILDEDGEFGVVAREDFKGRNKIKNPLKGWFRKRKKKGSLNKKRFDNVSRRPLEPSEQKELLKNPFLMQRFVKAMNKRMGLGGSISALFN